MEFCSQNGPLSTVNNVAMYKAQTEVTGQRGESVTNLNPISMGNLLTSRNSQIRELLWKLLDFVRKILSYN